MPIERGQFEKLARTFKARWPVGLYAVDGAGAIVYGAGRCKREDCTACREARAWAVSEGLRWGEPTVDYCPQRRLIWAVPIMANQQILGGLIAEAGEEQVFPREAGALGLDVRAAAAALRALAEEHNLTNAALLAGNRARSDEEQQRAEAIHAYKQGALPGLRTVFLREEAALVGAIRRGDRNEARGVLNRVLVAIHFHAGARLEVLKSCSMELISGMCRAAVEAGGEAHVLLGGNYEYLVELEAIGDEDTLMAWLVRMLDRVMDAMALQVRRGHDAAMAAALEHMRVHSGERLRREDVASHVGMSPSHFSRVFREHYGRPFSDYLNQVRVQRACELLARTSKPLVLVALETGFKDQSYFQKVFRRYVGRTPLAYRRQFHPAS